MLDSLPSFDSEDPFSGSGDPLEDALDYLKPFLNKLKNNAGGAAGKSLLSKAALAKSLYSKLAGDEPAIIVHRKYSFPLSKW